MTRGSRGCHCEKWRGQKWDGETTRGDDGQATVEFALMLPAVVVVVLLVLQSLTLSHDALMLMNTTREAARAAAVDPSDADARAVVAQTLPGAVLTVARPGGVGSMLFATVRYQAPTTLPFVGRLLPDPWLTRTVAMRRER